jgi:DNA-binding protein H-NS
MAAQTIGRRASGRIQTRSQQNIASSENCTSASTKQRPPPPRGLPRASGISFRCMSPRVLEIDYGTAFARCEIENDCLFTRDKGNLPLIMIGAVMTRSDLECRPVDELLGLYEKVSAQLTSRLIAKKDLLESRLRQLSRRFEAEMHRGKSRRRPYPKVPPKFRNPDDPSQTWTGRGRQPRWLAAQLRSGRRIEDFRIEHVS